ncbi:hypothetical protein HispidOSU_014471, partial [Sigmodon hispidus]
GVFIWASWMQALQKSGLLGKESVWPEDVNPRDVNIAITEKVSRKKSVPGK